MRKKVRLVGWGGVDEGVNTEIFFRHIKITNWLFLVFNVCL